MCFGTADWKREEIPDHKFSHLNIQDFVSRSPVRKLLYLAVFFVTLKSILVYAADLSAIILLVATNGFNQVLSGNVTENGVSGSTIQPTLSIPPLWKIILIVASVFASFVLLFLEWRKAKKIINSDDISYAFTSIPAYRYVQSSYA